MTFELLDIGCGMDPAGDVNCDMENVVTDLGCRPQNFVIASAMALPFKSGSFHKARMMEVLEHLDDEQVIAALKETRRVATKAVISVPNAYCIPMAWKYSWTTIGSTYRQMLRKCPHQQIFDEAMFYLTLRIVYDKVKIKGADGTWIAIPLLEKVLTALSGRVPFVARMLVADCE